MEAIWMVLVTLVLVAAGVLVLALGAHVAARDRRRSTGPRFQGSLGDSLGERSAEAGAGGSGSADPPAVPDTMGGSPARRHRAS